MMDSVDYKALLVKYIDHVGTCEGIAFLSERYKDGFFTESEWEALKVCEGMTFEGDL